MVSSCFTTFFLMSFFFYEAQTAAMDGVLVPEKYDMQGSARIISSDVTKDVDDAGVSSIVEARELRSRKMKLITRNPVYGYVADRAVKDPDTSGTNRKIGVSSSCCVLNSLRSHGEKKMSASDNHHVVAHNLKMRSRVAKRNHGFVAFSADYHIPKPHPPRNN